MNLIVCIDNNNGIMFNQRRVSRDSKVIEDILNMTKNSKIMCSKYTSNMFASKKNIIEIKEVTEQDGFYFHEDLKPNSDIKYNKIIVYNWNRDYPSDEIFTHDLSAYKLLETKEFPGSSHEKITRNIYERIITNEKA